MKKWLIPAMLLAASVGRSGAGKGVIPTYESPAAVTARGRIDELVFARLSAAGIAPANLCSDAVFVRRAYLDTIGTLPTAEESSRFLADSDPEKRAALIDRLLEREEFADYRAMKWSDLLRVKAEFPINLWPNAAQAYHHWIWESLRANKPYDRMAREMLTASGSNFRVPPVNFYRAMQNREPQGIAQTVALTFLGVRAEKWPRERLENMAVFFSQVGSKETKEWKEEILFFDPSKGKPVPEAIFPDGKRVRLAPGRDPREVFADWLTSPENPWFARAMANRVWSWLLGRGIVEEPDDLRPDNPPSNPELLAYLEQEFIRSHYDLKQIYRLILNSSVYQLSSIPRSDNPEAEKNFAYYPLRRLDAEVLIDALCQITGTGEQYTSAIPEPYTVMPEGQRAISLPDGSISSSFLELFGRPPRDTGLETERNNRPSAAQRLHLLNSTHVQRKLEHSPKLQELMAKSAKEPKAVVTGVYLTILSRPPSEDELKVVQAYPQRGRQAVLDLAWALLNTPEFLYRH